MNGSVRPIAGVFDVPTGAGHNTHAVSEQSLKKTPTRTRPVPNPSLRERAKASGRVSRLLTVIWVSLQNFLYLIIDTYIL